MEIDGLGGGLSIPALLIFIKIFYRIGIQCKNSLILKEFQQKKMTNFNKTLYFVEEVLEKFDSYEIIEVKSYRSHRRV